MPAIAGRGGAAVLATISDISNLAPEKAMPLRKLPKRTRSNAKSLRSNMTEAEKRLWQALREHRLEGIAFRRQMPIAGYIVDFAAPSHRLVVELDGSQHGEELGLKADRIRDSDLKRLGWTVLRFWNTEVLTGLDGVCRKILETCGKEQF